MPQLLPAIWAILVGKLGQYIATDVDGVAEEEPIQDDDGTVDASREVLFWLTSSRVLL